MSEATKKSTIKVSDENENERRKKLFNTRKTVANIFFSPHFYLFLANCVCQKIISTTSIAYPPPPSSTINHLIPPFTQPAPSLHSPLFCAVWHLRKTREKMFRATFPFYLMAHQEHEKKEASSSSVVRATKSNVGVYKFLCNYISQNLSYHGKVDHWCSVVFCLALCDLVDYWFGDFSDERERNLGKRTFCVFFVRDVKNLSWGLMCPFIGIFDCNVFCKRLWVWEALTWVNSFLSYLFFTLNIIYKVP